MLTPGFANPVQDSQATFRAILDATARPGTVHTLETNLIPPPPLDRATAAVLLTLIDAETPLWQDSASAPAAPWLAFHCAAPTAPLSTAAFALALSPIPLHQLSAGTDEAPETGATAILQVTAIGTGPHFRIEGPGLPAPSELAIEGLAETFAAEWAANHARFPRGIDLILCVGARLVALPRTLRVQAI